MNRRLLPLLLLVGAVALVVVTASVGAWQDGSGGWTEATAAVGLGAMVLAIGVLLGTSQGWTNGTRVSLAAIATGVVGIGAIALVIVTYAGSAGDSSITAGGNAAVVSDEGAALSHQISNNDVVPPGYSHDMGAHPTFDQFLAMDDATVLANVPGGSLLPNEVPVVKEQLAAARAFAETVDTPEKAMAAGYYNTTNDVPYMGAHFLSSQYVGDGVFDAGKPEGLLFSRLGDPNGDFKLVGVWYLLLPGINAGVTDEIPPQGFAGNLDLWHTHYGLCVRDGIISENNTDAGCAADQGRWIGDLRWMMHLWVWPETADNPEGVFTYLNQNLFEQQTRVQSAP